VKNIFAVIFILFAFIAGYSVSRFYVIRFTMQTDRLQQVYKRLVNESKRMDFRIDELKSVSRFEAYASDTLKMSYPSGEDYESGNEKYSQR